MQVVTLGDMEMDINSRAAQSYFTVMQRHDEPRDVMDMDLPARLLDPEETVLDVKVGATKSDTNPLLIVTDRRVLLAFQPPFRHWKVLKEAPASEVVGADLRKTLISGKIAVRLRDGSAIELDTSTHGHAQEFVDGINALVHRGQAATPSS